MAKKIVFTGYDTDNPNQRQDIFIDVIDGALKIGSLSLPYGDYPANNYQIIGPVIATTAAVLTITGLHGIHSGQFKFTLTTETLLIEALADSGATIGPVLVEHVDNATPGTKLQATALVAGTYRLASPFTAAGLKFTKSAAVNSVNLEGFLSGAS